jgi:hypothetical protein
MQTSQHDSQQTQAVSARSNKMGKKFTGNQSITAYKGFDADWTCRGFKYAIGKSYSHDGVVEACASGFHACEHPLDVFNYYPPSGSKFAVVDQSGDISRDESDTKIASRHIKIKAELSIAGLVSAAIEYVTSRSDPINPESAASATGDRGAASATGYQGAASATGSQGAASATGDQGAASATGYQGAASATGDRGAASATGSQGAASATGDRGAASATGYRGAASATGYQGAASATGDRGAASATGYQGAASATGDRGAASATGKHAVACGLGINSRAMAGETGAIVLVYRNDDDQIVHIRASKVGENGIKAGVFYKLDSDGQFVELVA